MQVGAAHRRCWAAGGGRGIRHGTRPYRLSDKYIPKSSASGGADRSFGHVAEISAAPRDVNEQPAQMTTTAMQTRHDRPERPAGDLRKLLVSQAFNVGVEDDYSVFHRQRLECIDNVAVAHSL